MNYEKIYEKNLKYLKENSPQLFEKIINQNIDHLELIINDDGSHNIKYKNEFIYPSNTKEIINKQVDNFLNNPALFFSKPGINSGTYVSKYTDKIVTNILNTSPLKDELNGYKFFGYKTPKDVIPFLILFGVGTGEYIEKIFKSKKVLNLLIIDKDYSFMKLSMHIIDWTNILDSFRERNKDSFVFIVGEKEEPIAYETINAIYSYNGMYTFYSQYLTHINCTFFDTIKAIISKNMFHAQNGWGFFEDEKLSLQHTLSNLKKTVRLLNPKYSLNSKVLIIGSGPSLDNDIKKIKKVKDNVIIISCGTALRTMWKNDIYPDLHIEIERNLVTYYDLLNIDKQYLKKISLICLNVLHPKVKTLFKESFMISRDNDAGSSILNIPQLGFANPTVVNGGINLALELGFKEIYLLGVDNGFKDPSNHHSKNTIHSDEESPLYQKSVNYILEKVKGNFIDEVYTTTEFIWSKQRIENCITNYLDKGSKSIIFNCSDGAFIKRTIPKRFNIKDFDTKKVIKDLYEQFPLINHSLYDIELSTKLLEHKTIFEDTILKIQNYINKFEIKNSEDMYIILDDTYQIVRETLNKSQITYSFLSGSLKIIYTYVYSHLLSSHKSEKDNLRFIEITINNVQEFLNYSYNMYIRIINNKNNFS